jgi:hypothetical protein
VPSSRSPVAEVCAGLAEALAAVGVRWYLIGAQAAILHGAARLSADVDVTVHLAGSPLDGVVAALARAGFEPRLADATAFAESHRLLLMLHTRTRMPVDLVLAGPGLEERFLAAAVSRLVDDVAVPVACAEDVVTMKILAGRPKDHEDVSAILRAQGDRLDVGRTRQALAALEQALDRNDLVVALDGLVARARGG